MVMVIDHNGYGHGSVLLWTQTSKTIGIEI